MTFLSRYPDSESTAVDVVVEDDGRVAYAYLRVDQRIVGDVWLFNSEETPEIVDFSSKQNAPFANPAPYVLPSEAVCLDNHVVTVEWLARDPHIAAVYLDGELLAVLAAGAKPGWSRFAAKSGPVAQPLAEAPWPADTR